MGTAVIVIQVPIITFLPGIRDAVATLDALRSYQERVAELRAATWMGTGSGDALAFIVAHAMFAEVAALLSLAPEFDLALSKPVATRSSDTPQVIRSNVI